MFHFQILHKSGTKNTVVDALSKRPLKNALTTIYREELESLSEMYPHDPDFAMIWKELKVLLNLLNQSEMIHCIISKQYALLDLSGGKLWRKPMHHHMLGIGVFLL